MTEVRLDRFEMMAAVHAGCMRRMMAIWRQRGDRYGKPAHDLWGSDIESAGAEAAFAKYVGLYWQALADDPAELPGDVGRFQVRHTYRPGGRLIIHPGDLDDATFVLVTGAMPAYAIRGGILGSAAKDPRWWAEGDGRPAFFVPQAALATVAPVCYGP